MEQRTQEELEECPFECSLNNKLPYVKAPNHNIDLGTLQQNNGHSYLSDT